MSTQLTPVTEQQKFIDVTLKGFNGNVQFVAANSVNDMVTRINAEAQAGSGSVSPGRRHRRRPGDRRQTS